MIEHDTNDGSKHLTRRRLLQGGGLLVAGTIGVSALVVGSDTTAASTATVKGIDARDATVTSNDGEIRAVYLEPDLELSWENFGGGLETIDVGITATVDGIDETIYLETLTTAAAGGDGQQVTVGEESDGFGAVDGTVDLQFDRVEVIDAAESIDTDTFSNESLAAGESETTPIELAVDAIVIGHEEEFVTVNETTTFDVTVTNPDGEVTVAGEMNTGAE